MLYELQRFPSGETGNPQAPRGDRAHEPRLSSALDRHQRFFLFLDAGIARLAPVIMCDSSYWTGMPRFTAYAFAAFMPAFV
jgi:hypothetical protein